MSSKYRCQDVFCFFFFFSKALNDFFGTLEKPNRKTAKTTKFFKSEWNIEQIKLYLTSPMEFHPFGIFFSDFFPRFEDSRTKKKPSWIQISWENFPKIIKKIEIHLRIKIQQLDFQMEKKKLNFNNGKKCRYQWIVGDLDDEKMKKKYLNMKTLLIETKIEITNIEFCSLSQMVPSRCFSPFALPFFFVKKLQWEISKKNEFVESKWFESEIEMENSKKMKLEIKFYPLIW